MPVSATAIPDEYRADVARAVEICQVEVFSRASIWEVVII